MSYILEALRKAERERNLGHVPTLEGLPPEIRVSRRRMWPWMLAAALVANVAVIALFVFFPRRAETPRAVPQAQVASAPVAEVSPPPNEEISAPFPDVPAELRIVDIPPAAELPPAPEPAESALQEVPPQPARVERQPAPVEPQAAVESAVEPPPASPQVALPVEEPEAAASTESSRAGVKELRDMPPDFRHQLPPMKLDAHFYSEDAERRFVMINLNKYKEGDRLSEGPQVDSIEPDGVVLRYQGRSFLLPLPR